MPLDQRIPADLNFTSNLHRNKQQAPQQRHINLFNYVKIVAQTTIKLSVNKINSAVIKTFKLLFSN